MKPDSATALRQLIAEIRDRFPFNRPEAQLCAGPCQGCSLKLLEYLESELAGWEERLADGVRIGLAEISNLIRTSQKIARVLEKSHLMPPLNDHGN